VPASRGTVVALGSVVLVAKLTRLAVQTRTAQSSSTDPSRAWLNAYRVLLAGALPWQ
jgi:hypothetical protein